MILLLMYNAPNYWKIIPSHQTNPVLFRPTIPRIVGPTTITATLSTLHPTASRLMTFYTLSRLGNQMFLLASLLGISRSYPVGVWTVCVNPDLFVRRVFPAVAALPTCRPGAGNFTQPYMTYNELRCCHYYSELMWNISTDQHVYFKDNFLQSWKYFVNISDDVRRLFQFSPAISDRAKALLKDALKNHFRCRRCLRNVTAVGVHVRRGDLVHVSPDVGYFHRAMDHEVRRLYPNFADTNVRSEVHPTLTVDDKRPEFHRNQSSTAGTPTNVYQDHTTSATQALSNVRRHVFVVCSEDLDWCLKNIGGRDDVIFIRSGDAAVDLAILSMCHGSIIATGSYGWWAAWLAGGHTVANDEWTPNFSLTKKDYFPPSWLIM